MLTNRAFWASRSYPLLSPPDGEGGGSAGSNGDGAGDPAKTGTDGDKGKDGEGDDLEKIEGLGDKGKEAIRKERDARKAAEDARKTSDDELVALRKEKADREDADQKAKDDAAKESGKWEELATKREGELKSAKDEAATLKGQNDQLRTAISGVLDSEWKELPKEVQDAYLGAEDDPLAKLAFLPKGKALAAKLAEKDPAKRGNGADPKPSGNGATNNEAASKAQSGLYRNF